MSKSKIVKAPFVAMSDIRKEIKTIDPSDPNIIKTVDALNTQFVEGDDGQIDNGTTEDMTEKEAVDDDVIDGSLIISREEIEAEINEMIEAAKEEAEAIRASAKQEGYDVGFVSGQEAANEILDAKMKEFDTRAQVLAADFEEAKLAYQAELEPKVAYVIRELVLKMVGKHEDDPGIILFLVKLAFEEIHTYGSFVIKVSGEDFDYAMTHKDELTYGISEKVDIEILKDISMKKNQCFIETEMGNVDCSLNIRLESLEKELKLIGDSLK